MKLSSLAAGAALVAAVYEAAAIWFDWFPTITDWLFEAPVAVRYAFVGTLVAWLVKHFKIGRP